jgi:hypothetical protein
LFSTTYFFIWVGKQNPKSGKMMHIVQVFSPNYPFPYQPYIVCRYFIYGMQDSQNLERVALTFDKFDIPIAGKTVAKTPAK